MWLGIKLQQKRPHGSSNMLGGGRQGLDLKRLEVLNMILISKRSKRPQHLMYLMFRKGLHALEGIGSPGPQTNKKNNGVNSRVQSAMNEFNKVLLSP